MRLLAGVAGLALAVLHVGRHPATRRLSEDAVDACEYCENLTRDWETRVCRILSGGAGDGSGFADFFFSGIAANATRAPRYECANSRFVSFRRLDVTRVNRALMDRGEKLPEELIDVVVEFLELPRWRPAPAPKKE